MFEFPHKLPHELRIKILGSKKILRKSMKYLNLMVSTQSAAQKTNFDICARKSRKKTAVKHSIEKHISVNFVNLSTNLCPRL